MFVAILDWMLANTPSFLRPGAAWLINGLRKITGYVASLWNLVGSAVGNLYGTIAAARNHVVTFAATVVLGLLWLRFVWVPAKVNEGVAVLRNWTASLVATAKAELLAGLHQLYAWTQAVLGDLRALVASVIKWAMAQVARIDAFLSALLRALAHVLSGPDVLAEWLIDATWRAALRYTYAQRDRIANWLLRGSLSFTAWVGRVVEDTLLRML